MMSTYTAEGGVGAVSFAAKVPGHIVPIDVSPEAEYMVHRHGFMAATPGVQLDLGFQQSFRGGVFGGMGFILQKITGTGRCFIDLSGEVLAFDLQPGQSMRVHPGHVGLFQASVTFQVVRVPGLVNRYMGEDGHHFAVMTGPGRIWLQSMPIALLAGALRPFLGDEHPAAAGAAGGAAAGMLGSISAVLNRRWDRARRALGPADGCPPGRRPTRAYCVRLIGSGGVEMETALP